MSRIAVVMQTQANLFQVIHARLLPRVFARGHDGGDQQTEQYREDQDDYQQFDPSKTAVGAFVRHESDPVEDAGGTRQRDERIIPFAGGRSQEAWGGVRGFALRRRSAAIAAEAGAADVA